MNKNSFTLPKFLLRFTLVFILVLTLGQAWGQIVGDYQTNAIGTWNWTTAANWQRCETNGTWVGATSTSYPGQNPGTGVVTIQNNTEASLDVSPANNLGSLVIANGANNSGIVFAGFTLNVTGATTINPNTLGINKYLHIDDGSLSTGSISMTDGGNNTTRDAYIRIAGGTVNVTGNFAMVGNSDENYILFVGAAGSGSLNVGGTLSGGGITSAAGGGASAPISGTVNFDGTGAQGVPAYNYYNLTLSGARTGANNITLINGGTIGVSNTFSAIATFGTGNYVITNNTINFNGTGAQTISAFNYNNLTISGARTTNSITLANTGTIGIGNTFTNSATFSSGAYINTGSTIAYNGNVNQNVIAFTYNDLTISVVNATAARAKTLTGDITINGNLFISGTTDTFTTELEADSRNITIDGTTTINAYGIFDDDNSTGTNTFVGRVTIDNSGSFGPTSNNSPFIFQNGITNNGIFTKAGTGSTTFNTNPQILEGINTLTFSGGDLIISDPVSLEVTTSISFSGTNFTNNSNKVSSFNATAGTFTFVPNAAQNINGTGTGHIAFYDMAITANTKTANLPFIVNNNLNINGTSTLNLGTTVKTIDIAGNTTINGSLNFGTGAAKTVTVTGDLVDVTGTITMTGAGLAHSLNLGGVNNAISTFTTTATSGSTVTYNCIGDQTVFGSVNYRNLILSGGGNKVLQALTTINNVLTLTSGVFQIGNFNLSLADNTVNAIQGMFSSTNMIETDGTGYVVRNALTTLPISYPVGAGGYYSPASITAISATTGTINVRAKQDNTLGSRYLQKYWDVITSTVGKTITATFNYDAAEILTAPTNIYVKPIAGNWQNPTGTQSMGTNAFTITGTTTITNTSAYWTAGPVPGTYFSYQTGNWDNPNTWTSDPGGTTQVGSTIPGSGVGDVVVILSGRTVSLSGNVPATTNLEVNINDGGILDMKTFAFTSTLLELNGQGTLKLASTSFPAATTNNFVTVTGGTTEYNNTADFTLPIAQTTYNHLKIYTPGFIATQLSNITLNGNLNVTAGTYRINDNTANRRQLTINGNVTVDAGASITVGTGVTNTTTNPTAVANGGTAPFINYYAAQSHRVVILGDFTNNGTVKFTNLTYPIYNLLPPTTVGATSGFATVYFQGATNNTLTCNGTTDFYNLVLDKGVDQSFALTVYSSAYSNFRLFGANIAGGYGGGANPNLQKALWIRTGTLKLQGLTIIPSLTEANTGGTPNGEYYLPSNGYLLLDGSEVIILSTADDYTEVNRAYTVSAPNNAAMGILATGGTQSFSIYGKFQVNNGYFSTRESGGLITWNVASGQIVINGGTVDVKQFRSAGGGGGLASYDQSGGTLIMRGRFQHSLDASSITALKNTNLNTTRSNAGLNGALGTFNLNEATNVFAVDGGTIRIYDVCGDGTSQAQQKAFEVLSSTGNINVTGGTLELIPTTGTVLVNSAIHSIISTAPLGNLTINRASSAATVQLVTYPITILNNLNLTSGDFSANNLDINVGGNITIASGTTYTPGTNTTILNGTGSQTFTVNLAAALTLNKFTIDKAAGSAVTFAGTQTTINVADNFRLVLGTLNDNGNTINLAKDCFNSGLHAGSGKIVLNASAVTQTIDGNGIFKNLELNNTNAAVAPVALIANATINGTLNLVANKIFNIGTYNLNIGATGSISATAFSNTCYIHTNGQSGDGGISKAYSANTSFVFPVGSFSTKRAATYAYTPATIALSAGFTGGNGTVTVIPVGYEHPATTANGQSLTYYWRVKSTYSAATITANAGAFSHTFVYSPTDVNGTLLNYIPSLYDRANYSWNNGLAANINTGTSTITDWASPAISANFLDADYTAGDAAFGTTKIYYSRINGAAAGSGLWSNVNTWSTVSHTGAAAAAVPGVNDIVIIGALDSVYLATNNTVANTDPRSCASLQIEIGSALDIGYNPGCNFGMVLSHSTGNGNFRLTTSWTSGSTYIFPSGDFSDFNANVGTTELYSTNPAAGTTYWLPNGILSYGNLILSPLGGSNIIFPNNNLTVYGNLITRGQNADSWFCPTWNTDYPTAPTVRVAKTITVNGKIDIQGGGFIWYGNGAIAQNIVVKGDLKVATLSALYVWSGATNQSVTIGGSLINNTDGLTHGLSTTSKCDFTNIPLIFNGSNSVSITNTTGNPTTIFSTVTVNKGTSQATTLTCNIGGTLTTPANNWLTFQNGTFIYNRPGTNLTLTTTSPFTIPATAGLTITNASNVYLANGNVNTNDLFLNGELSIASGNVYVGPTNGTTANNNDIEYSGGGASAIDIQGGNLIVNGQIRRNASTTNGILNYTQSGGNVIITGQAAIAGNAKLEVCNTGSVFNLYGGTITIVRGGGTTYGDLYLRAATSIVTGGEIIFTQSPATPATVVARPVVDAVQNYVLDANVALNDFTITGKTAGTARNATVTLLISPLVMNGNLTISNANSFFDCKTGYNINVTIKGGYTNNGTYNHYNNLTTFSGGVQSIAGSSATDFYNLMVNPVTSLTLIRDVTVSKDLTLSSGQLLNNTFSINVKGNLVNNANYNGDAVQGGVILNGTSLQNVSGTGTFGRLEVNNASGARLLNDITLQKNLKLSLGILDINQYMLTLGENSLIEGSSFSSTKMIASDGAFNNVGLRKYFGIYSGVAKVFTYPIGTSGKYTPAVITYTDNSSVGYMQINNINDNHPSVIDPTNVLNYYWEVSSFGITGFKASMLLNYLQADVQVTGANLETSYIGAGLLIPGTSWTKNPAAVDASANTITFDYTSGTNGISGEFTAGIDPALPIEVPQFTSIANGAWSDKDNWLQTAGVPYTLTGAPTGFIVTVDVDDIVTIDDNNASAYRTIINGKLKVVSGTFGHNLGTVSGNGTLNLETATFPAGRYTTFFDCSNNSTLEYGGTTNYSIIADLYSSVPKLHFTGSGTKTLPNKDLTICTQLLIDGATLDNSVNNKKLTIQGTMERLNSGVFNSGSGAGAIVSFAGIAPQTIGGALGNFTGTSDFNHFEINNSTGLTVNASGDIEVAGNLLLTSGNIVTTLTNKLTITNTAINSVTPLGGQLTSFVNGPLVKKINQGDNFQFPIGKGSQFGNKINLSISQVATVLWTAEYFTPNSTYTSYTAPLSYVNSGEFWTISAPSGSQATININWDTDSDLTPLNTVNGLPDMRVTKYNTGTTKWDELTSTATGNNNVGTVSTSSSVTIPAAGTDNFTTACINTVKPKAKLTPTGPVCGTAGIPVTFTPTPTLNYTLDYTLDGVAQTQKVITAIPYTLPTPSPGTYKLTAFTYNGGGSTGAVDAGSVIAYALPTVANAGPDQSLCGLSTTTLAGNTPVTGTGLWSIVSGTGGTVTTPTIETSPFNGTNGTAYTLQWKISNGGCVSTDQVGIVFPILAAQPAAFTISSPDVCNLETGVVYRVPLDATVSYIWDFIPSTGVTINGTTNSITADFASTASSGTISVKASNSCGLSAARTLSVTVNPVPVVNLTSNDVDNVICNGAAVIFTANSLSGPAITNFDFQIDAGSVQSSATSAYSTLALVQGNKVRVIAMSAGSCTTTSNELTMSVANAIWTGSTSTDWFTIANWSCVGVPNITDDLIVPTGATLMPIINAAGATFRNIIIQNAASLTTAGTNNIDVYGNWTNDGSFVANTGSITFNGTSTVSGAASTTFNNIIINATKTLTASAGTMNVTGNITNSGTFNHNNGTLVLNGTAAQTISGVNDLYNLQINNAAGVLITDNTDLANNLTLTDGIITMGSGTVLAMTNAAGTVSGGSTSSYVNGKMSKVGTDFVFPIGNATQFKRIELIAGSVSTTWSAQYIGNHVDLVINDASAPPMIKVSKLDRWFLGSGATPANGTVRLYWNTLSDVGDGVTAPYSALRVAMLNGATQWTNMGNTGIGVGSAINNGTVTSGVVSFSDHEFTIGSTNSDVPLPVNLILFTGIASESGIELQWMTSSEENNDFFELQRSIDAVHYNTIANISGAGTSKVELNYSYMDKSPNFGTNYYRLKQVDFDGAYEVHPDIAVDYYQVPDNLVNPLIAIYPNPYYAGDLMLNLINIEPNTSLLLEVFTINGKSISSQAMLVPENHEVNLTDITGSLAKGIYLVRVITSTNTFTSKLVVN